MKKKFIAGILALFLGGLGIHKFYLDEPGKGILYLLFCWTFIPAIIAFFEALIIFFMSEEEFDKKYNKAESCNDISAVESLERLSKLRTENIINQEEFDKKKAELIKKI